jgi:hypothetical protein
MKRRECQSPTLVRPAGLWLRCFLNCGLLMSLCVAGADHLGAQVDIPGPERLSHVEGFVVNPVGRPVAGIEVKLLRDEKATYQTKTGKSGEFRLEPVKGQYTFQVARTEYAPALREIVVTDEVVTVLERKKLYVILGPGACKDECSSVLTSKREFHRAIREKNRH